MRVVFPDPRNPVMIVIGVGGMVWCVAVVRRFVVERGLFSQDLEL